jgi:Holliday junction resolvase RusA-like endonuclease
MAKFVLPLPPTTNQIYRTRAFGKGRAVRYMTKEAKEWERQAREKIGTRKKLLSGPVEVCASFYLKYDRDVDNLKVLMDCLEGSVIVNDKQVQALHVFKEKDADRPRVILEIYPLEE